MTTASTHPVLSPNPTVVPNRVSVSGTRRLLPLESIGRRLVFTALARLTFGRITLIDGADPP